MAGFSITTQAVGGRRAIGYVPQAVSADGSLTGYENLLIFAKLYDLPHRKSQAWICEALDFMGLKADGGRLVGQYSGGMLRPPANRPVQTIDGFLRRGRLNPPFFLLISS